MGEEFPLLQDSPDVRRPGDTEDRQQVVCVLFGSPVVRPNIHQGGANSYYVLTHGHSLHRLHGAVSELHVEQHDQALCWGDPVLVASVHVVSLGTWMLVSFPCLVRRTDEQHGSAGSKV